MRRHKYRPNYPVLNSWIETNGLTYDGFAKNAGISRLTLRNLMFNRDNNPSKETIDKILAYTGMVYEVCFVEWGGDEID